MGLRIYNALSNKVEEFAPRSPGSVTMYTCGPTVYRDAHIGNLRSYLMADWIRRALEHEGYAVHHVKNITDVGHMRQEMLERGEDKVIVAALAEGKTPQEIASLYTDAFFRDEAKLNILPAKEFPRATDHVQEMVDITQRLEERGHAYEVQGNVYFSVSSFSRYGQLSGNIQSELLQGVRAEVDPLKRDPRDFALWKAAEPGRSLKWSSPWGEGYPGWHIECSAMSMKYLGPQLDIHTGGVDNIFPHHEGEIAQSEGTTGLPFVRYWIHGQHLLADGVKMAKSAANDYTIGDLEHRGFDPLAFRYLCLTARFNTRLNFTFSALRAAQRGLTRLRNRVWVWSLDSNGAKVTPAELNAQREAFWERVHDNLDMPGALAQVWNLVRSPLAATGKLQLLFEFDAILGLGLADVPQHYQVPEDVTGAIHQRASLRRQQQYANADSQRQQLRHEGYTIEDTPESSRARPMTGLERRAELWPEFSSSQEVPSLLQHADSTEFSVVLVACNYRQDVQRCVESTLRWSNGLSIEVVAVDNGCTDGTSEWVEDLVSRDHRVRVVHTDHILGEAAARNIGLKQSLGHTVIMLDTSVEVTGDLDGPLQEKLRDPQVGVAGPFGLRTADLRHFDEVSSACEVDAMQAYCFAFRRADLKKVGWMPESFRFYRNLDIQYSFQFKASGFRILADPTLPVRRHEHRVWSELVEEEREKLSRDNFRRFLKRWDHRRDLLVAPQEHEH